MGLTSATSRGYVAAVVGAVVGAFVLAVIGALLGYLYAEHLVRKGLDQFGPPIIGFALGIWAGAALGCLLALLTLIFQRSRPDSAD